MTLQNEIDAVRLCQQQQEAGLVWLIQRYQTQALKVAYLLTGNHADAEDMVQESFVQAWRSIQRFNEQQPFGHWFMKIVVNNVRMHLRTRARHPIVTLDALDTYDRNTEHPATDPVIYSEQNERCRVLLQAISHLTTLQREAIVFYYYSGYSTPDIAKIVSSSPDAIRRRIHDGIAALKRLLDQDAAWLIEMHR